MKRGLLLFILIILMVTLVACGGSGGSSGSSDKGVELGDGKVSLDGTIFDFGTSGQIDKKSVTLKTVKASGYEEENGLSSPLYELTLKEDLAESITISMPIPEGYTGEDGETLMIGLGVEAEYDSGRVGTEYFYFPAEIKEGLAQIEFSPSELVQAPFYMGATEGSAKAKEMGHGLALKCGLFTEYAYFKEGGHFILYHPMKVDGKFFHHIVGIDGKQTILNDLEAVYEKYKKLGFKYNEKDFPMNILVKKIDDDGSYHGLFKDITINTGKFTKEYVSGDLNSLLWHEFFHYVQGCYTGIFGDTEWIDEATASYYEATAHDKTSTTLTSQYFEKQFTSVIPVKDTAQDGYARSPLIAYLAKKNANDTWIKDVYEKGGNNQAFIDVVGDPATWVHDYYLALTLGQVGEVVPYTLHKSLVSGAYKDDVGTKLTLKIPEADEIDKAKDNDLVLGSAKVTMNGQGARFVAITVDKDELKKLPEGADVTIGAKGAELTLLSARGKEVNNLGKSLTGLKKSLDENKVYVALITSPAAPETVSDFEVKVKLAKKKVDFSGTYLGIMNVTQTDKDYDVTTVVTYEKDFGDGAYYKIVATNDDTGNTYIKGSYFVRQNGEANIAGTEFKFAPDGMSFNSPMLEFNGKVWGNLTGQK